MGKMKSIKNIKHKYLFLIVIFLLPLNYWRRLWVLPLLGSFLSPSLNNEEIKNLTIAIGYILLFVPLSLLGAFWFLNDTQHYVRRAQKHSKTQNYQAALIDFTKAIELQPNNARLYFGRGYTYLKMEDFQKAIIDFDKAVEFTEESPDNYVVYESRGEAYHNLKNYQAALIDYTKAIELRPNDAIILTNRGTVYAELENFPDALSDFDKAIGIEPKDAIAYYRRGLTYDNLQNYTMSLADYSKAIELQPDNDNPVYNTACIYAQQLQVEKACFWLQQAIQISAKNIELAKTDTDFDSIRNTVEFKILLSQSNT